MKKIISLMLIVIMVLSFNSGAFADVVISNKTTDVEKKLVSYLNMNDNEYKVKNSDAYVKIDFDRISELDEQNQRKILDFIEENGIDTLTKRIQEWANEMEVVDSISEPVSVYEYYITDEDLDENGEVDISKLTSSNAKNNVNNARSSTKYYSHKQYHLETFKRGWKIEYNAFLGLTLNIGNGKIKSVKGSTFNIPNMPIAGSYSDIKKLYYINKTGSSCSYNINYKIQFGFDIPIFDFGLPVQYEKLAHDSLIARYK